MNYRVRTVWILLVCLTTASACAQLKTRLLSKDEFAASAGRLSQSLVPGIIGPLHTEAAQAFSVEGAEFKRFSLLPVSYGWQDKGATAVTNMCGIFVVYTGNAQQFLPTIGMGWLNVFNCHSLDAVGFVDAGSGVPPRILLLYSAATPHDIENEPAVLDWSSSSQNYVWNQRLSSRLVVDGQTNSIAEMKRQLRRYEGQ